MTLLLVLLAVVGHVCLLKSVAARLHCMCTLTLQEHRLAYTAASELIMHKHKYIRTQRPAWVT